VNLLDTQLNIDDDNAFNGPLDSNNPLTDTGAASKMSFDDDAVFNNTVSKVDNINLSEDTMQTTTDLYKDDDNAFANTSGLNEFETFTSTTTETVVEPVEEPVEEEEIVVSQNDLLYYYMEKNPELFNDDGVLTDVDKAIELGIGVKSPTGPVVPTSDGPRVIPDSDASGLILQMPDDAEEIVSKRKERVASAARTFSEDTSVEDAAAEVELLQSEEYQNAVATMTDDELNAFKQVWQTLSGDVPTKQELALRLAKKEQRSNIVSVMEERASAFTLLDKAAQPEFKDSISLEEIQEAKRVLGDDVSGSGMAKFIALTGPAGLSLLEGLGGLVNTVGDKYRDVAQNVIETVQDAIPEVYDEVFTDVTGKVLTPKEVAADFGTTSMEVLESFDALIAIASQGRLSSGVVNPLAKLPVKLNKALNTAENSLAASKTKLKNIPVEDKVARKKQRAEIKRLAGVVAARKKKLSEAVDVQIDKMRAEDIARLLKDSNQWNKRLNITRARFNTKKKKQEIAAENKRIADKNKDVTHDLIVAFEQRTDKNVSDINPKTKLKTINPDKARKAGEETSIQIMEAQQPTGLKQTIVGTANVIESPLAKLQMGADELLTSPVIKPDKIEGLTAAVVRLKNKYPDAFKPKKFKNGRDYNLIDHLFELTVNKKLHLLESDDLFTLLNKSDISFEDYILTVVHGGSQAGKIMNQLSQLKRLRPRNELDAMRQAHIDEVQHGIRQAWLRVEGARRGGLVSQIATAARNAESALVRAPMEGLGNVIDNVLYQSMLAAEGKAPVVAEMAGLFAASKSLLTFGNSSSSAWQGSMRHLAYIFRNPKAIKEYNEFIFETPKLEKQFTLLFKQMNELQQASGRGDAKTTAKLKQFAVDLTTNPKDITLHKTFDATMSVVEDAVWGINVFNRLQEFLIRRGVLFGEMDRLMKREWNIDFVEEVSAGNFSSLMNDAAPFRPKNARTFMEIFEESTQRALDITYAKQPDIEPFRDIASLLVRTGGTLALPFPRFMFNGIELVGQYSGGALLPAWKRTWNIATFGKAYKGGQLGFKDRQRISRNIVGLGAIIGMAKGYEHLTTTGQQPADYTEIPLGDGSDTIVDIGPQHPLRPIAFLAKALEQHRLGTLSEWIGDGKEAFETFVGTAYGRTGIAADIVNDIRDFMTSNTDLIAAERSGKAMGNLISQYLNTWMTFFNQFIELERAGISLRGEDYADRPLVYKDVREDPVLDWKKSYDAAYDKPSIAAGRATTAAEEAAFPNREFIYQDTKTRKHPLARVFLGLTMTSRNSEAGDFLKRLGYDEYKMMSKSQVPSIQRYENKYMRETFIPVIVDLLQASEVKAIIKWNSSPSLQNEYKQRKYVVDTLRAEFEAALTATKQNLKEETLGIGGAQHRTLPQNKFLYAMRAYRSLTKAQKNAARGNFVEKYGRIPEATALDLLRLAELGRLKPRVIKDAFKNKDD
tara:strand:- start:257 stop:4624 length:4368 start_codon:yes stop_codon:yes gene_type:complete